MLFGDRSRSQLVGLVVLMLAVAGGLMYWRCHAVQAQGKLQAKTLELLTETMLQHPQLDSVHVVWFTEFAGTQHTLQYGEGLGTEVLAETTQLSRMAEDNASWVGEQAGDGSVYQQRTPRPIWRHEAIATDLTPGQRIPYRVSSQNNESRVESQTYTLAPKPSMGQPLKILLTSDHQLKPMTSANIQKVQETVGAVDAIFFAGDLVNVPDRASEWFDDSRGFAFFPVLQGTANFDLETGAQTTTYTGGSLLQTTPLFTAIGNHEVMGRFAADIPLNRQFNDPVPRLAAQQRPEYVALSISDTERAQWLQDNSFNIKSYTELFTLPTNNVGDSRYYTVSFGDIYLIVLYATSIWRPFKRDSDVRGRYQERQADVLQPEHWGWGQHIFEPINVGSEQYQWLQAQLASSDWQAAKYKIVMLHHPIHTLGDNGVPAYTDPVQVIKEDADGQPIAIDYEYPLEQDYLAQDVAPLLEAAGVQLVFNGHSHLWNRFTSPNGTHYLETSNVGNTYGAYWGETNRPVPDGLEETYVASGDPNGLEPQLPTVAPLMDAQDRSLPYIASNRITAFSVLDTATGVVSSYYFDTQQPESDVILFDELALSPPEH